MPTPPEVRALLRTLATAPARLGEYLNAQPAREQLTNAGPGTWSPAQIFAHIRASDDVLGYRCLWILSQDEPRYPDIDERRWEAVVRYAEMPLAQSIRAFAVRRDELVAALRRASSADWARSGVHAERGPQTLWTVASLLSEHEEEHIAQLRALCGL